MPYKRIGKTVYHKKGDRWTVKQVCDSVENAEKAIRLLQAVEHNPDFKPRRKK